MGVRYQTTWKMWSFMVKKHEQLRLWYGIDQWSGRVLTSVLGDAKTQLFYMCPARGIPIPWVNGDIHCYNMAWNVACFVIALLTALAIWHIPTKTRRDASFMPQLGSVWYATKGTDSR